MINAKHTPGPWEVDQNKLDAVRNAYHNRVTETNCRGQTMKLRYQIKDRETGHVMREVEAEDFGQAAIKANVLGFDVKYYYVSLVG